MWVRPPPPAPSALCAVTAVFLEFTCSQFAVVVRHSLNYASCSRADHRVPRTTVIATPKARASALNKLGEVQR